MMSSLMMYCLLSFESFQVNVLYCTTVTLKSYLQLLVTIKLQVQRQVAPQNPSKLNDMVLCLNDSIIKMLFADI